MKTISLLVRLCVRVRMRVLTVHTDEVDHLNDFLGRGFYPDCLESGPDLIVSHHTIHRVAGKILEVRCNNTKVRGVIKKFVSFVNKSYIIQPIAMKFCQP